MMREDFVGDPKSKQGHRPPSLGRRSNPNTMELLQRRCDRRFLYLLGIGALSGADGFLVGGPFADGSTRVSRTAWQAAQPPRRLASKHHAAGDRLVPGIARHYSPTISSRQHKHLYATSKARSSFSSSLSNSSVEEEIAEMERQVLASAREQIDYNQITKALIGGDFDNSNNNKNKISPRQDQSTITHTPTWQIALTAATVTSGLSFVLFSNIYVSLFVLISIFLVANADPVQDDSGLVGPLARIVGRATLQSYQTSKPTLQALARAVVTGQDEVRMLRQELETVQARAEALETWKQRRLWVEDNLQKYTVEELKQKARDNQLPVGGTKLQLLQRLVDANVMDIIV